ncbi:MAG: DUF475 domain-containing protein [Chitinophagales bacterium]|nr:DUF475 domain-containing protein [Chitinophagales bacterium]MDW8274624.1 DUF475 domain-containing protein [Chitinophagales bacterium]
MDFLPAFIEKFTGGDLKAASLIIFNLIIIESLLSVDNAAVLATMVMDLPTEKQRRKALRIGLILAYIFRGTALVLAGWLMHINFLKLLGGGYLFYLSISFFLKKILNRKNIVEIEKEELSTEIKHPKKLPFLSLFWSIVLQVELMDLTFSLDNVFAAVAFTDNIYLVCTGVFIGIITMRIVAGYFVKLLELFPFLDSIAFFVIGLLGLKLCISFSCHYFNNNAFCTTFESERTDMIFSLSTILIFVLPILYHIMYKKLRSAGN